MVALACHSYHLISWIELLTHLTGCFMWQQCKHPSPPAPRCKITFPAAQLSTPVPIPFVRRCDPTVPWHERLRIPLLVCVSCFACINLLSFLVLQTVVHWKVSLITQLMKLFILYYDNQSFINLKSDCRLAHTRPSKCLAVRNVFRLKAPLFPSGLSFL